MIRVKVKFILVKIRKWLQFRNITKTYKNTEN